MLLFVPCQGREKVRYEEGQEQRDVEKKKGREGVREWEREGEEEEEEGKEEEEEKKKK